MANIYNTTANTLLSGSNGSDSITNSGSRVTIDGGKGNDTIYSNGANVSINAGLGKDLIDAHGSLVTVDAGDGNDKILNDASYSQLNAGYGDDSIRNYDSNVTIDAGDGNDYIKNGGSNVSINGGDGNDDIYNYGGYDSSGNWYSPVNVTINAGAGDNYITLKSSGNLIEYTAGDGNDIIEGFNESDTLTISGGEWSTQVSGSDVLITVGEGSIRLFGAAGKELNINSTTAPKLITLSDERDVFGNDLGGVTLNALGGNDNIYNTGNYVSLDVGEGNDDIYNNNGSLVTINGGAGNDSILNYAVNDLNGRNVLINAGDGKDTIDNSGDNVTINGGAGNDQISLYNDAENVLIQYKNGDGNDLIQGFNATSTLQIGDGNSGYSSTKSGGDVIVTVGKGKITLVGAATLSVVNIAGEESNNVWTLDGTTATYGMPNKILITVNGVTSLDGISLKGKTVTVSASSLGMEDVTISDGYTLKLGSDVDKPVKEKIWSHEDSTATYKQTTTAGYDLSDDKTSIVYTAEASKTLITVSGVTSLDGISLKGKTVTVSANSLGMEDVTISDGYTLKLGSDVDKPVKEKIWSHEDSTATYKLETNAGYALSDDKTSIVYTAEASKPLITVNGVKFSEEFKVSEKNKTVTVPAAALNETDVTISDGYTLRLGSDVDKPVKEKIWSHEDSTATYKQTTTAGYDLSDDKTSIVYTAEASKALITVSGVTSLDGISLKGKTVTVSASSLGMEDVTISDGYVLKLGSDVDKPVKEKIWSHSGTTATYKLETNAGYDLSDDKTSITYTAEASKPLITVNGVKFSEEFKVSEKNKTVTVPAAALNETDVTISDGYTLRLGSDVDKPVKEKIWSHEDSTATYKQTTTAGYDLSDDKTSITYTAEASKALITVNGVKSANGLKVSEKNKTVTVPAAALNETDVTISDGYTLRLGSDVDKPVKEKIWSHEDSTATYKQTTTAGYDLSDDKTSIVYTAEASKALITVSGVKFSEEFKVSEKNKTVTVPAAALNETDVTISDGYTLKLGSDAAKTTTDEDWALKSKIATYKQMTTEGYDLSDDKTTISYTPAADKELISIKGVKKLDGITLKKSTSTVKLEANALANKVTVSGNYAFDFASSYSKATITGSDSNDTIIARGKNISVNGGAGNDSVEVYGTGATVAGGEGADVFHCAKGNGNYLFSDYAAEDTISLTGGTVGVIATRGSDVIFNVDTDTSSGKISVTGGADKTITYYDENGRHTYQQDREHLDINATTKTVTLFENYSADSFDLSDYGKQLQTVDASAVQRDMELKGNDLINKLIGGAGNDTLIGGKGNDELFGDGGSDIFVYKSGDGNDVILDYDEDDLIQITSGNAKISTSGDDVIFKVGKGKITVAGGANKIIRYYDKDKVEHFYPAELNGPGTAATLLSAYSKDTFDVAKFGDYATTIKNIDASAVRHNLTILGNGNPNKIIGTAEDDYIDGKVGADTLLGGKGSDSLLGGKGDDVLKGEDGADFFLYAKGDGNDTISDYTEDDTIKITAGTVNRIETRNKDVLFTVGNGSILVKNGSNKAIRYYDAEDVEHFYPVDLNAKRTSATLTSNYGKDTFNVASFGDYATTIKNIDASAVEHNLRIFGNALANSILGTAQSDYIDGKESNDKLYGGDGSDTLLGGDGDDYLEGGAGNDSLWGGAGNDTLFGGAGEDIFVCRKDNGNDVITDYTPGVDTVMILSGKVGTPTTAGNDVIFTVGTGQITFIDGASKYAIELVDASGEVLPQRYVRK